MGKINQTKRHKRKATQNNLELRDQDGVIRNKTPVILNAMAENIEREHHIHPGAESIRQ